MFERDAPDTQRRRRVGAPLPTTSITASLSHRRHDFRPANAEFREIVMPLAGEAIPDATQAASSPALETADMAVDRLTAYNKSGKYV
jgi:hypothetical protein